MSRRHKMFCKCGQEITVVKVKRGHKHYVCPGCGIIASNPLPLAALALPAAKVAGSWLAWKAMDKLLGKSSKQFAPSEAMSEQGTVIDALKGGALSTFEKAILAELADKR